MCSWQQARLSFDSLSGFFVLPLSLHGWEHSSALQNKSKLPEPEALPDIWILFESLFWFLEKVIPSVCGSPCFWKVGLAVPYQNALSCPVMWVPHCFQVLPDAVQALCRLGAPHIICLYFWFYYCYVYIVVCAECKWRAAGDSTASPQFTGKFYCD